MHSVQGILAHANDIPVVAKGNCGIPAYVDGAIHYHGTPELMAEYALFARDAGAKIIGGCCVNTPGLGNNRRYTFLVQLRCAYLI